MSLWESQSLPVLRIHVTCPLGWSVQIGYHSQPALQQAGLCYLTLCNPHAAHSVGSLHLPPAFPSSDNLGCMAHILTREQWLHAKLFLKMQVSRSFACRQASPSVEAHCCGLSFPGHTLLFSGREASGRREVHMHTQGESVAPGCFSGG